MARWCPQKLIAQLKAAACTHRAEQLVEQSGLHADDLAGLEPQSLVGLVAAGARRERAAGETDDLALELQELRAKSGAHSLPTGSHRKATTVPRAEVHLAYPTLLPPLRATLLTALTRCRSQDAPIPPSTTYPGKEPSVAHLFSVHATGAGHRRLRRLELNSQSTGAFA